MPPIFPFLTWEYFRAGDLAAGTLTLLLVSERRLLGTDFRILEQHPLWYSLQGNLLLPEYRQS